MDIMPTFLDAADADYTPYSDNGRYELVGSSLLRLDEGAVGGRDRTSQWVHFGTGHARWLMQRSGDFKYVFWYNGGCEELYDLSNDPDDCIISYCLNPKP